MEPADSLATSVSLLGDLLAADRREEAWAVFAARYGPLVRRWCERRGLQPADADDVAAGVARRLLTGLAGYHRKGADTGGERPFRPWLRAVVENAIRDHFRDRCRHPGDYGAGDGKDWVGELAARPGEGVDVEELVRQLSDHLDDDYLRTYRAVRERRGHTQSWAAYERLCLGGEAVADVAAALGMTPAAVSTAAYRVRAELNAEYEARVRRPAEDDA